MKDFALKVNLVAVVRVRAGGVTGRHATITDVDFSIGSVKPFEKSG
jgi:hypothetical protein